MARKTRRNHFAAFQLCWRQHGGSGLSLTWSEAMDLPVSDRDWLLERCGEQREREAKAVGEAFRKR